MTTQYMVSMSDTDLMLAENALLAYFVHNRYSELPSKQMLAKMSDEMANYLRDLRIAYEEDSWSE